MTIVYVIKNSLYVNLTNRCTCACTFCLRQNGDGVFGSDSLWLEREPSYEEVIEDFKKYNLDEYDEVVFCGYGEPTERLDCLLKVAAWIKSQSGISIRINTNGLSDLSHQKQTAPLFKGLIDTVSISLNTDNQDTYLKLTRSKFGIGSFDAMLKFAEECKKYVPHVVMTVVDVVTSPQEQKNCKAICDRLGVTLRIRPYEE